jgi:hypothetical protein
VAAAGAWWPAVDRGSAATASGEPVTTDEDTRWLSEAVRGRRIVPPSAVVDNRRKEKDLQSPKAGGRD